MSSKVASKNTNGPRELASAIYEGNIRHQRLAPKSHQFNYRVFMMYLDLDEIDEVLSMSRWWSKNRLAAAQFRRSDFIGPESQTIKMAVQQCIFDASGETIDGPVRLLCNLRYFGFIINPISCYYCFDQHEKLRYIVAEVTNTPWQERVQYVIPCASTSQFQKHQFSKKMHVSPFMPMQMSYHWKSKTPGPTLRIHLENWDANSQVFNATLSLDRKALSSNALNSILLRFPLMTMKIMLAIHWQALRLFLKRLPIIKHRSVTTIKH